MQTNRADLPNASSTSNPAETLGQNVSKDNERRGNRTGNRTETDFAELGQPLEEREEVFRGHPSFQKLVKDTPIHRFMEVGEYVHAPASTDPLLYEIMARKIIIQALFSISNLATHFVNLPSPDYLVPRMKRFVRKHHIEGWFMVDSQWVLWWPGSGARAV